MLKNGDEQQIEHLILELGSRDQVVAWDAGRKLAHLGVSAVPNLLRAAEVYPYLDLDVHEHELRSQYDNPEAAWKILRKHGDTIIEPVLEALQAGDPHQRRVAAGLLAYSSDARVVEALLQALNAEDRELKKCVVASLGTLKDPRAIGPLLDILRLEEPGLTYYAISALLDIADLQTLEPIIKLDFSQF